MRCAKVPFAYGTGYPEEEKGQTAEAFLPSRAENAGLQKNILKTVTKVGRYHSGPGLYVPFAVNVGAFPNSRFFV